MSPVPRLHTIDAVRGFAVLGILVMNVNAMALPAYAYLDPTYYGGATGANLVAWAAAYVLADGKMRMIFSMLFGASMGIVADAAAGRTPGAAATHYRRMGVLLGFGLLHAYGLFYGDILVEYAVAGSLAFVAWHWPPRRLAAVAALLFLGTLAFALADAAAVATLREVALGPAPPADAVRAWGEIEAFAHPPAATIAREIALYRSGFAGALEARWPMALFLQTVVTPPQLPLTIAFMLAGLLLHRTGFLAGAAPRRLYLGLIGFGYLIALPLHAPLVVRLLAARFDPATMAMTDALSLALRPCVGLAHMSVVILLVRSGARGDRLAAAGRIAFSNYLGTSIVVTSLFNGYGLGLFGRLERAQLWWVILPMWALILLWSRPWLVRFRYGPLEWLWRSLARGRCQPIRMNTIAND